MRGPAGADSRTGRASPTGTATPPTQCNRQLAADLSGGLAGTRRAERRHDVRAGFRGAACVARIARRVAPVLPARHCFRRRHVRPRRVAVRRDAISISTPSRSSGSRTRATGRSTSPRRRSTPRRARPVFGASRLHPQYGQVLSLNSNLQSDTRQFTASANGFTDRGMLYSLAYTYSRVRDQSSFAGGSAVYGFCVADDGRQPERAALRDERPAARAPVRRDVHVSADATGGDHGDCAAELGRAVLADREW